VLAGFGVWAKVGGVTRVGGRLALVASAPPVAELVNTSLLALLIDVASDSDQALRVISATHPRDAGIRDQRGMDIEGRCGIAAAIRVP
jgi:hypothetical protein